MATEEHSRDAAGRVVPPTVVLFAVGLLAVLVILPRGAPLPLVVAAAAAVSLPLFASMLRAGGLATGVFVLAAVVLGGLAIGGVRVFESLWLAALVLVLFLATLLYGLHRYERVALGLEREGPA